MVSSYDYVPNIYGRHYVDKDGNPTTLSDAILNDGQEIDPVQDQIEEWTSENYHSLVEDFSGLMKAFQILENRLRIEYAGHTAKYEQCRTGSCDIIYDLKSAYNLVHDYD